ncbi:hypothetical protein V6N12_063201 [Hibiscus sabdariffa]|uniref:Uncharacterized protein n=1 Tax=Hibiscus sabdariffa TaxID=183260 RepID=A0ABR2FB52_9ROSI
MTLVDSASSSDDEVFDSKHQPWTSPLLPPLSPPNAQVPVLSLANQKPENFEMPSVLLISLTVSFASGNDHASVVVAVVTESEAIPHSKSIPDAGAGALFPLILKEGFISFILLCLLAPHPLLISEQLSVAWIIYKARAKGVKGERRVIEHFNKVASVSAAKWVGGDGQDPTNNKGTYIG